MIRRFRLAPLAALGFAAVLAAGAAHAGARKTIRVVVWDEQQPIQKEAYENFLGNAIADHLRTRTGEKGAQLEVRSVRLDDPQQGLAPEVLDNCDVLIWWGHVRHGEIKPETAKALVRRITDGKMSLLALHSAHWSVPFIEAMNERTMRDAMKTLAPAERERAKVNVIPAEKRLYRKDEPVTPSFTKRVQPDGSVQLDVKLPSCVFTGVKNSGTPSHIRTVVKDHPIAKNVPATFTIPRTEIYDGPFHVPTPDVVIFDEKWDTGEQFPAGCFWNLGKGKVFYFRPGHETYPIFKQPEVLQIVENAVRFLGKK